MHEPYAYRALEPGHIRLIKLQHHPFERQQRPIQFQLIYRSTIEALEDGYACLSYTWGDPRSEDDPHPQDTTPHHLVMCNDQAIFVRENLHHALCSVMQRCDFSYLWVDAICINQDNVEERSSQVAMMADIFAQCQYVCIWLGESDWASKGALPLIDSFGRWLCEKWVPESCLFTSSGRSPPRFMDPIVFGLVEMDVFTPEDIQAISSVLRRSWFRRLWTLQESMLPLRAVVRCGGQEISYERVTRFAYFMKLIGWRNLIFQSSCTTFELPPAFNHLSARFTLGPAQGDSEEVFLRWMARHLYSDPRDRGKAYASRLVLLCRPRQASDPRDKIFAPLSMARKMLPDFANEFPSADYSKSMSEVFTQFTKFLTGEHGQLTILAFAERGHHFAGMSSGSHRSRETDLLALGKDLPSWVPDFHFRGRSSHREFAFMMRREFATCPVYNAAVQFLQESKLAVKAWKFCTIARAEIFDNHVEPGPDFTACLELAKTTYAGTPIAGLWSEAFILTATSDRISSYDLGQVTNALEALLGSHSVCCRIKAVLTADSVENGQAPVPHEECSFTHDSSSTVSALSLQGLTRHLTSSEDAEERVSTFIDSMVPDLAETLQTCWLQSSLHRSMISTEIPATGLAPECCMPGDEVWILPVIRVPLVFRQRHNGNHMLLGEAYVHGYMNGEAFASGKLDIEKTQDLVIE